MIPVPIFSQSTVNELYQSVEKNIESYKTNNWQNDLLRNSKELKNANIPINLGTYLVTDNTLREGEIDAKNSEIIFEHTKGLTPYQARDERIITAICHITIGEYAFFRHKKLSDKSSSDEIRKRFFARGGSRSIERDNVFSSLWWNAHFVERCKEKHDRAQLLHALCSDTDFRSQLVERPTLSKVPQVALAILKCKLKLLEEDKDTDFFSRRSTGSYRKWFRLIDFYGGTHLYAAMSTVDLIDLFWRLLVEVKGSE